MYNLEFLNRIRAVEIEQLAKLIPAGSRVLEFGAGTGEQAKMLAERGFEVVAIDLPASSYANDRLYPVIDYDGRSIPLPDRSVDVVFSSNVLEHVEDLPTAFAEFRRVLRPGGVGVHAMPTPAWRFWTFAAGLPTAAEAVAMAVGNAIKPPAGLTRRQALLKNLKTVAGGILPVGHGTSPEGISELWSFSPRAWRKVFARNGFEVIEEKPIGLFYTGHMLFGGMLSFNARKTLSRRLGSATQVYVVKPADAAGASRAD